MVRFFRNIRQRLLVENRFSRYFIYAIGEILLVIIGILIALAINNWNQERKLRSDEQILLQDLKIEMESNIGQLNFMISKHEVSYKHGQEFMALFQDREVYEVMPDSLFIKMFMEMTRRGTFDPSLGILNSMISSGQMNDIRNKELRHLLSSLKDIIKDATEDENKIERYREEYFMKMFPDADIVINGQIVGSDIKRFYDHSVFRTFTNLFYVITRRAGLKHENELKETLEHILHLIENEIKEEYL